MTEGGVLELVGQEGGQSLPVRSISYCTAMQNLPVVAPVLASVLQMEAAVPNKSQGVILVCNIGGSLDEYGESHLTAVNSNAATAPAVLLRSLLLFW